jgi:dipeptidase
METKFKVLGVERGITITRPFNPAMFAHNDKVREIQNSHVRMVLDSTKASKDLEAMKKVGKAVSGYGYGEGHTVGSIYNDAIQNLETASHNWMREDIWPDLIKMCLVSPIDTDYVGYKKLNGK